MLNQVQLIGNIGKDIELRHTDSGHDVAAIRLATTRKWTDKATKEAREETEWHDIEVWGATAKACAKHVGKGDRIYVGGRLKTDKWEKDGQKHSRTKVIASEVKFLGGKAAESAERSADEEDPH